MKFFLIILIAFLPIHIFGQNFNEITEQEYANIEFEDIPLTRLKTFQGDVNNILQLFNLNFTNISNDTDGEAKDFSHPEIELSYHGFVPNMQLLRIIVKSPNITVEILGEEIQIGDNISVLGYGNPSFKYKIGLGGDPYIATFKPALYSSYVRVEFDASGTILNIEYISLT